MMVINFVFRLSDLKRNVLEKLVYFYLDETIHAISKNSFVDFYSEETVNNQGLECLRFLNEVISDFDAVRPNSHYNLRHLSLFLFQLLELPQFQDIIKIKTIGSTYMAASGLNPTRQVKVNRQRNQ